MALVPLGRILQLEEVGGLVVYLASLVAGGMTGQANSHCGSQVMWQGRRRVVAAPPRRGAA